MNSFLELIGMTEKEVEKAMKKEKVSNWRFVGAGMMGTADYKPGRINVQIDKSGKVDKVTRE